MQVIQRAVVAGLYEHIQHERHTLGHVRGERPGAVDVPNRNAPQTLEEVGVLAVVEEGGAWQVRQLLPLDVLAAEQYVTTLLNILVKTHTVSGFAFCSILYTFVLV